MTETYYKATRPDGTSFYDGTTRWEVGKVTYLPDGLGLPYLSVSVVATDCTGMKWPCRLFRVEPVEGHEVTSPEVRQLPNKRGATAWRVVEELDARQVFGPNADEVLATIDRVRTLTADEARKTAFTRDAAMYAARDAALEAAEGAALYTAWDAARGAAADAIRGAVEDAIRGATWEAAWEAVRSATWEAAWEAAWEAVWDAMLATLVRDLITPEQYELLTAPWRAATENA